MGELRFTIIKLIALHDISRGFVRICWHILELTLGHVGGALGSNESIGVGRVADDENLDGLGGNSVEELALEDASPTRVTCQSPFLARLFPGVCDEQYGLTVVLE